MRRMPGGSLADRLEQRAADRRSALARAGHPGRRGAGGSGRRPGSCHGRVVPGQRAVRRGRRPLPRRLRARSDRPAAAAGDDVHDFAVMVAACLAARRGPRRRRSWPAASATAGRPADGASSSRCSSPRSPARRPAPTEARRTRTRGCGRSTRPTPATSSVAPTSSTRSLGRLAGRRPSGRLVLVVGGSGTRQVQRGAGRAAAAGTSRRRPRVRAVVRHDDAAGLLAVQGARRVPAAGRGRRPARRWPTDLADDEAGIDRVLRRLVPGDGQLLLVVDQLEELFTLASEQDQRAFLDGLMHAVSAPDSRLRLVATLRADFYDRPLAYQPFGAAVNDATVDDRRRCCPRELEAAIVEPAERVGGRVERALVAELVSAVVDEPAALPSLQFTLYELAETQPEQASRPGRLPGARRGRRCDRRREPSGSTPRSTTTNALAVRRLFERLVIVVGSEGEPTRRRAARTELARPRRRPGRRRRDRPLGAGPTADPRPPPAQTGCPPSSSPTRPCSASGPVSGAGSRRTAEAIVRPRPACARRPPPGSTSAATRGPSTAGPGSRSPLDDPALRPATCREPRAGVPRGQHGSPRPRAARGGGAGRTAGAGQPSAALPARRHRRRAGRRPRSGVSSRSTSASEAESERRVATARELAAAADAEHRATTPSAACCSPWRPSR